MRPYLLLDRDGTLIEERHYLREPEGVAILPGTRELLAAAREAGWGVAILTNQSGVARGLMTLDDVRAVHERMLELIGDPQLTMDHIFICPHGPDDPCDCRKPLPGLALEAARKYDVDLSRSLVVGDRVRDLQAGRAVGAHTALVRTGYGAKEEPHAGEAADWIVDGLAELIPVVRGDVKV